MGNAEGCFKTRVRPGNAIYRASQNTQNTDTGDGISLQASLSSSIYKGSTFQPNALRVLAAVKF